MNVQRFLMQSLAWCFISFHFAPAIYGDLQKEPAAGATVSRVDVQKEIWPILRTRCIGCHGPSRADGELRLDEKKFIDRGGHTGNAILGTAADSELLRRLTSMDEDYRMPKNQYPLSSDEVELFTRWVEQGADWPEGEEIVLVDFTKAREIGFYERLNEAVDVLLEVRRKIGFLGAPFIVVLLLILWIERRKRNCLLKASTGSKSRFDGWVQSIGYSHYASVALMMLLTAVSVLLHHAHQDNDQLHQENVRLRSSGTESQRFGVEFRLPKIYRPKHPPRMKGEYYRGNDERNAKLFNGGYYRTATFRISLKNEGGDTLEWNDEVPPGKLSVYVEIEKAPFATKELFGDSGLKNAYLTLQAPREALLSSSDVTVNLDVIESGQRWGAQYPILEVAEKATDSFSGTLYLSNAGQAHYGITYDIDIQEGRVAKSSELWMGAVFLTGNVTVPAESSIALNEWFDFLPIPEIENGNTDDPVLLGIPEHQKSEPEK
jgi:Planctomycete cytochrome C